MAEPQLLELSATDFVLFVLSFAVLGYFAKLAYDKLSGAILPKPAPVAAQKKQLRAKAELLKPVTKKAGIPEMSLGQLADACSDTKLLIGCKGRIFDASANAMYGPEGAYNLFVGKDASVALAKMKFDKECLDPSLLHWARDLDEKELNILEDWVTKFEGKYEVVAYIKDDLKVKI